MVDTRRRGVPYPDDRPAMVVRIHVHHRMLAPLAPRRWTLPIRRSVPGHPWDAARRRRRKSRRLRRFLARRHPLLGHRYSSDASVCNIRWTSSPCVDKDARLSFFPSGTSRDCRKHPAWQKLWRTRATFRFEDDNTATVITCCFVALLIPGCLAFSLMSVNKTGRVILFIFEIVVARYTCIIYILLTFRQSIAFFQLINDNF